MFCFVFFKKPETKALGNLDTASFNTRLFIYKKYFYKKHRPTLTRNPVQHLWLSSHSRMSNVRVSVHNEMSNVHYFLYKKPEILSDAK